VQQPYFWRRGITPQRRAELNAALARGDFSESGQQNAWDYVFYYQRRPAARGGGYKVLNIYTNGELISALSHIK
jgi:outer membrane protein assembly factor BamE (lipoprotein component of BamABCDE complex)